MLFSTRTAHSFALGWLAVFSVTPAIAGEEATAKSAFSRIVQGSFPMLGEFGSWWTARHSLALICVLGLIVAVGALWVLTLRRKVHEQTAELRERLEHEAALEQRCRQIYETASDLIFTNDLHGKVTSLNPAARRMLGYENGEVHSLTIDQMLSPASRQKVRELCAARSNGHVTTCELELVGRSGQQVVVEASTRLVSDNGQPAGLQAIARDVTKRRQMEIALQQSEQKFRSIVEKSLVGVYIIADGLLVYANPRLAEIFGYALEEVAGSMTVQTVIHPEDWPLVKANLKRRIDGQADAIHYHFRGRRKDGSVIHVEALGSRTEFDGRPAVVGSLLDISERWNTEADSLLTTMLENSPDLIYFKDSQSRFVRYSNSTAARFSISHPDGIKGKTDFDLFADEHARVAYNDEQEIIRTGKPIIGKTEKETLPDGKVTWALTTKMPWRDKAGNMIGTFGISKDVTGLKEIEEKLAFEQALFRTLLDNIPDSIYFKDRESRSVRLSKSRAERLREYLIHRFRETHSADEPLPPHLADLDKCAEHLVGLTTFDVYPDERASAALSDEKKIMETGEPLVGKVDHAVLPDGKEYWYLTTKMPWYDPEGNVLGTFGIARDITQLKEAEQKLQAAHQRLLETSRLAGMAEVASDVLHNVGNVLNSINVSCSLTIDQVKTSKMSSLAKVSTLLEENSERLAEFFTSDPRGRQLPNYLAALSEHLTGERKSLLKELEQLLKHIDHIKQIVAMQQSYAKVAGVLENISPTQLVDDALHINAAALSRHDVQLKTEFEPTPSIITEKHKVLQILVNLIRNAKYALDDSKRTDKLLRIRIVNEGTDHVKIQVIDNGVGIPPENLTRIFSHGFTTRRNGHGFGLHSSALAVRDLGGSLSAESEGHLKGATFNLLLPHRPSPRAPESANL